MRDREYSAQVAEALRKDLFEQRRSAIQLAQEMELTQQAVSRWLSHGVPTKRFESLAAQMGPNSRVARLVAQWEGRRPALASVRSPLAQAASAALEEAIAVNRLSDEFLLNLIAVCKGITSPVPAAAA